MKLTIRNQTCHLLPECAVFWEEQNTLIIADIHIGKGTVFRKSGIPIPQGIMDDDLKKITDLVSRYKADHCIVVGDLIHAKSGLTEDVKLKFSDWLKQIPCKMHLILGNHDYSLLHHLPPEWDLNVHKEGLLVEPFYFSHYPKPHNEFFVWSGHLHPKVEIKNTHDRIVLRCFQIFPHLAILPAFGFFVGGTLIKKSKEAQIFAIADQTVIEL